MLFYCFPNAYIKELLFCAYGNVREHRPDAEHYLKMFFCVRTHDVRDENRGRDAAQ